MTDQPVLVPLQLQAFVLNPAVCGDESTADQNARIAPITQPNYTFLRLSNLLVQSDIQNHVDLHSTVPANANSRMTDLGQSPVVPRRNRFGVYLHWILPRAYRAATPPQPNIDTPQYRQPPTRWVVVRKVDLNSIVPSAAQSSFSEYSAWVIESDYRWQDLDSIPLDYDLQVDVAPFIIGAADKTGDILQQQAEVFIGRKTRLEDWPPPAATTPPADISLLRSSNQLFADFQLHNANVFSILDNFEYKDSTNAIQYLTSANADYYLLGWHNSLSDDPFSGSITPHSAILQSLSMSLADSGIPDTTGPWLQAPDSTRLLCHGAMYGVEWQMSKKPTNVPADKFARRLQAPDASSVAVGTTPLDALLSYCSARFAAGDDQGIIKELEQDILAIQALLHARDDGVEGQREAADMSYDWNFSRQQGGIDYFLTAADGDTQPQRPGTPIAQSLTALNQTQLLYDACQRTLEQYRWDMFSLWWTYVSGAAPTDATKQALAVSVNDLTQKIKALAVRVDDLDVIIKSYLPPSKSGSGSLSTQKPTHQVLDQAKTRTLPPFNRARDPTVLVGGIDSGWPADFLDLVTCRIPEQIVTSTPDSTLTAFIGLLEKVLTDQLLSAAQSLMTEFQALGKPSQVPPTSLPQGQIVPQFHDTIGDAGLRDHWNDTQPWFPLFIEWEAEYTHIPFEWWSLDAYQTRLSTSSLVRYGLDIPGGDPLWEELGANPSLVDTRVLSGRSLILPQPSFSLAAKVGQLFQDTPPAILDKYLKETERAFLINNIAALSYLSAPLAGLTEQLLTTNQGSHVKPENKTVTSKGEQISAIPSAVFQEVGFTTENIEYIMSHSAFTPFATMVPFPSKINCPFKPVTHGQVRFRKFNIIDKFGQTLCAIDPKPSLTPAAMFPCISDFFEPELFNDTLPNTVEKQEDGHCEFFQIPPQINQDARMNAAFVTRTGDPNQSYWRPINDWECPIWGWIVVNYADYGLQLFLPDGTFYREVRIGGPEGSIVSPKWLPFAPDSSVPGIKTDVKSVQLDGFIKRLNNPDDVQYLQDVWYMLTNALDSLPAAPSAYAEFLNAIVGKPLALVNMGWSLEVSSPPLLNQSHSTVQNPPRSLLPNPNSPSSPHYTFQIKIGDEDREYDGLVAYFSAAKSQTPGNEFDLDSINTYFSSGKAGSHLSQLTKATYPKFDPFWIQPFVPDAVPPMAPDVYTSQRNQHLQVFSTIMDPFTAIHAYSSIIPCKSLQLPPWTWQQAMNNMTAFFHAGPVTMTQDVPPYSGIPLTTENVKDTPLLNVSLPSLGPGAWSWLQPYDQSNEVLPSFNALGIDPKGNLQKPGFQQGPYTAVEGYLQLRQPIMVSTNSTPAAPKT